MRAPKPHGRGIVKALGQTGTTGRFAAIARAKGKGAAIGALQNKLAAERGQPAPFPPPRAPKPRAPKLPGSFRARVSGRRNRVR